MSEKVIAEAKSVPEEQPSLQEKAAAAVGDLKQNAKSIYEAATQVVSSVEMLAGQSRICCSLLNNALHRPKSA